MGWVAKLKNQVWFFPTAFEAVKNSREVQRHFTQRRKGPKEIKAIVLCGLWALASLREIVYLLTAFSPWAALWHPAADGLSSLPHS
jgi:hypothetical protein